MNQQGRLPEWASSEASEQLPSLCASGEGKQLEFKQSLPVQAHDVGKSIAAFASSDGGQILYGVADDGTVVGLLEAADAEGRDAIQRRIVNAAKEVKPPAHPVVQWAVEGERAVCVVRVEKGFESMYYSNFRPVVRRGCVSRPAEPGEVEHAFRLRYASGKNSKPLPSTRQIAARMREALKLMNVGRHDAWEVADFARAMDFASPAGLDAVLEGRVEPTFALIDQFCERFAVDKEWVSAGRGTPFGLSLDRHLRPSRLRDLVTEVKPQNLFLVRSSGEAGESFIFAEADEMKIWRISEVWHVSDQVGGAGALALVDLYELFKHWSAASKPFGLRGVTVTPDIAISLMDGTAFPGIVKRCPRSDWWDDLTDLDHARTARARSARAYGKSLSSLRTSFERRCSASEPA